MHDTRLVATECESDEAPPFTGGRLTGNAAPRPLSVSLSSPLPSLPLPLLPSLTVCCGRDTRGSLQRGIMTLVLKGCLAMAFEGGRYGQDKGKDKERDKDGEETKVKGKLKM